MAYVAIFGIALLLTCAALRISPFSGWTVRRCSGRSKGNGFMCGRRRGLLREGRRNIWRIRMLRRLARLQPMERAMRAAGVEVRLLEVSANAPVIAARCRVNEASLRQVFQLPPSVYYKEADDPRADLVCGYCVKTDRARADILVLHPRESGGARWFPGAISGGGGGRGLAHLGGCLDLGHCRGYYFVDSGGTSEDSRSGLGYRRGAAACGLPADSPLEALAAVGRGTDVYMFLTGMMVLAELARREGFFDFVAVLALEKARGSPRRLFAIVYVVGTVVTIFLSNDADGGGFDAGGAGGVEEGSGETASIPADLRVHRECGQLRAADLESGESGGVWIKDAAACRVVPILWAGFGGVDRRDVFGSPIFVPQRFRRRD